ncbi:MAG: flagellar basal body rod protein FlgC [Candidatus Margulisiibacteriota bacterium]
MKRWVCLVLGVVCGVVSHTPTWALIGSGDALEISRQGVLVQKFRLNLIATNVANAFTLMTDAGTPYRRKYAILESTEYGVRVASVRDSDIPFGKVFDPANPFSNKYGILYLPNVNIAEEMVDVTYTNILYEANTTAFKAAKSMVQQTIDVLK